MVRGRAIPIYGCKNWGKNPYYTVLAKPYKGIKPKANPFESIDGQYNWLGLDEQEAQKFAPAHQLYDDHLNHEMMQSQDDWGNPQDRSAMADWYPGSRFMEVQDMELSQHYGIEKHDHDNSEEVIAVNDSENSIIIPEDMEVQDMNNRHHVEEMY